MSAASAAANAAIKGNISNSSSSNNTIMTRAVYLARLRRAFLLRVHPDRFPCPEIRQGQAILVKALAERMSHEDFTVWQSSSSSQNHSQQTSLSSLFHHHHRRSTPQEQRGPKGGDFTFAIERRRDGTLLQCKLRLDQPVDAILNSMADTLRQSGIAPSSLPIMAPPPTTQSLSNQPTSSNITGNNGEFPHGSIYYNNNTSSASWPFSSSSFSPLFASRIDHRYDVVSNHGRNLQNFLSRLNPKEIASRKAYRTDAQAAALQVRRIYQFQAVDATSLGWSSASVAVLLNRLLALHQEHANKFHVQSFYPIRLVFWPDDDMCNDYYDHSALDVHGGGVLSLNPAATPLQWLEKIQLVNQQRLNEVVHLRSQVQHMTSHVQDMLGGNVKLLKGFSCSNRDYHDFLYRLCPDVAGNDPTTLVAIDNSGALVPEPQLIIVESHQACRGSGGGGRSITITKNGAIQVSAGIMEQDDAAQELIRKAIHKLGHTARERRAREMHDKEQAQEWSRRAVWELGLQRVYRTTNRVSHADFVQCLGRLLSWPQQEQAAAATQGSDDEHHPCAGDDSTINSSSIRERLLKAGLTGNGLGIASTGQFCHLADDGSVVIPHDWR